MGTAIVAGMGFVASFLAAWLQVAGNTAARAAVSMVGMLWNPALYDEVKKIRSVIGDYADVTIRAELINSHGVIQQRIDDLVQQAQTDLMSSRS